MGQRRCNSRHYGNSVRIESARERSRDLSLPLTAVMRQKRMLPPRRNHDNNLHGLHVELTRFSETKGFPSRIYFCMRDMQVSDKNIYILCIRRAYNYTNSASSVAADAAFYPVYPGKCPALHMLIKSGPLRKEKTHQVAAGAHLIHRFRRNQKMPIERAGNVRCKIAVCTRNGTLADRTISPGVIHMRKHA